ncbi:MAG TPA: hypothetical protein VK179_05065 [Bacteroidales bacterium]|nr:hypothetical protein [Bacteroidales bacterium]
MVKLIITFLNILVLLALQMFSGDVSVKLDAPSDVQAGSEFEVKVTVNKGNLEGFSRLQQNIPAGLIAAEGTSSNADFSFTDKRVRLIWLKVPSNDQVTVSYKVKVNERLKGTFTLGGKFSYIRDNERVSVDIDPVTINITPSPDVDPSLVVDINDFEKMIMPAATPDAISVACIRQRPVKGSQGDYLVNMLVSKNLSRQFAKIEENVPAGYTAVAVDPKNAIFTFKDQKVKFLWMNVPDAPYFSVSYRLIPKNQAKLAEPAIKGAFSYLVDQNSVSVDILERDIDIASLTNDNAAQLIAQAIAQPEPVEKVQYNNDVLALNDSKKTEKPVETKTDKPKREPKQKQVKQPKTGETAMFDPENGVYYRIQLAAGHQPINIRRYFGKMNLEKKVQQENHDGWKKYSIGSFAQYKDARDYRVHIWNTTPVKDAFITAYNNGKRITVQEALMITEQKWYQ